MAVKFFVSFKSLSLTAKLSCFYFTVQSDGKNLLIFLSPGRTAKIHESTFFSYDAEGVRLAEHKQQRKSLR